MRYFKCESQFDSEDLKATYSVLVHKKEELNRRAKVLDRIGTIVFFIVSVALFIANQWLIIALIPKLWSGETWLLMLFSVLFCVVIVAIEEVMAGFLSLVLGAMIATPLWMPHDTVVRKEGKRLRKEILQKNCQHLWEFYELQEPCIVTKCYDSSDKRFKNHDICLFVTNGELRLTTNLHHGFLDMRRDLGCYAFVPGEIELSACQVADRSAVEIRCGEVAFLLGQRAKSFVEQILVS